MKILYILFEKFVQAIEYLEENGYEYKWTQTKTGYEVTIKY